MQSNGGVMPFAAAITGDKTVHTLFSGLAARAQAGPTCAEDETARSRHPRHGRHQRRYRLHRRQRSAGSDRRHLVARRQLDVPALDLTTISAVADRSCGSTAPVSCPSARKAPAPIRDRSVTAAAAINPTVTDADIVCGFLNPDYFLGGTQKLDADAARVALQTRIAEPMNMTLAPSRGRRPPHR